MNIESFNTTKWVVTQVGAVGGSNQALDHSQSSPSCAQDEYAVYQVSEPYVPQLIAALDAAVNGMKVSASLSDLGGGDTMMYLV